MEEKIKENIKDINKKILELTKMRTGLISQTKSIDNRITQLIGAVEALSNLIKKDD